MATIPFPTIVEAAGLPVPIAEHRFAPPRRWRFDYAWPDQRLALEVEGGVWSGGRHVRGKGYEADCEKYNAAALAGWKVLRVTTAMLRDGRALALLKDAFDAFAFHQAAGGVGGRFFNDWDSPERMVSRTRFSFTPVRWS